MLKWTVKDTVSAEGKLSNFNYQRRNNIPLYFTQEATTYS